MASLEASESFCSSHPVLSLYRTYIKPFQCNLTAFRLQDTKFSKANKEEMKNVFDYLQVCLEKVVMDNELGALTEALRGSYVEPGPGGDPIRNPLVLPTGKNIHALDPQSIPTAAAVKSAKLVVER